MSTASEPIFYRGYAIVPAGAIGPAGSETYRVKRHPTDSYSIHHGSLALPDALALCRRTAPATTLCAPTEEVDFMAGDLYGPDRATDFYTAGIHVRTAGSLWGNRIEMYGRTAYEAGSLRDIVLTALHPHAPPPDIPDFVEVDAAPSGKVNFIINDLETKDNVTLTSEQMRAMALWFLAGDAENDAANVRTEGGE